jgi:hypothetical protein
MALFNSVRSIRSVNAAALVQEITFWQKPSVDPVLSRET